MTRGSLQSVQMSQLKFPKLGDKIEISAYDKVSFKCLAA